MRRRGLLLFAVDAFEWVWPGQILGYYGAYLALGSFLFTWRPARLLALDARMGLVRAPVVAAAFWAVAVALAAWWRSAVGIGPAERIYRRFGG